MARVVTDREQELADYVAARWPSLLRLAYLLTGDAGAAEDLVQSALVNVCGRLRHLRDPQALDAYVRRAMVNLSIKRGKRRWRQEIPTAEVAMTGPGPDDHATLDEHDRLLRALQALTRRQQVAVVLRYYADLSEADTAAALGCATGTVKSLTARGLATLRVQLLQEEETHG